MTFHSVLLCFLKHFVRCFTFYLRQLAVTSFCHHEVQHLLVIRLLGVDCQRSFFSWVITIQIEVSALNSILAEKHLDITFAQPQNARAYFFDEGFAEKNANIEIATEVVGSYEDVEDICFRQLKDETDASVTFTGDYSQITEVCMAITMWIKENGYELDGANFCIYHKGWGQCDNPKEFMTEICFPIRK